MNYMSDNMEEIIMDMTTIKRDIDSMLKTLSIKTKEIEKLNCHKKRLIDLIETNLDVSCLADDIQEIMGTSKPKIKYRTKIKTNYEVKPIPIRNFDWTAVLDDYDSGDEDSVLGQGRTELEAIEMLLEQLDDKATEENKNERRQ